MEKGMAGDRQAATGMSAETAAPGTGGRPATVEREPGPGSTTQHGTTDRPKKTGSGGAPSGSATHPFGDREVTIEKTADGRTLVHDSGGEGSWQWEESTRTWRGLGGAADVSVYDAGDPGEVAADLAERPNLPRLD